MRRPLKRLTYPWRWFWLDVRRVEHKRRKWIRSCLKHLRECEEMIATTTGAEKVRWINLRWRIEFQLRFYA